MKRQIRRSVFETYSLQQYPLRFLLLNLSFQQTVLNAPKIQIPLYKTLAYTKIVADKFAEKKSVKKFDEGKLERRAKLQAIVESVVTEGRVSF